MDSLINEAERSVRFLAFLWSECRELIEVTDLYLFQSLSIIRPLLGPVQGILAIALCRARWCDQRCGRGFQERWGGCSLLRCLEHLGGWLGCGGYRRLRFGVSCLARFRAVNGDEFSGSTWEGREEVYACVTGEDGFGLLKGFKADATVLTIAVAKDLTAGCFSSC